MKRQTDFQLFSCFALSGLLLSACQSGTEKANSIAAPTYATEFRVVRVDATASVATQLAVHACAGLHNRKLGGSVFVQPDENVQQSVIDGALVGDEIWLDLLDLTPSGSVNVADFLNECVLEFDGCVRYSYASQQAILPSILTTAAALEVVPLADESPVSCLAPKLDATQVFAEKSTPLLATQVAYENYLAQTTGLAMLNPGYEHEPEDLANPGLIADMPVALIDFVFSRKLFVAFLINGCIDDHPENALLSKIVAESPWETPIGVYGYNDSWLLGGYLYEAQTRCLDAANMGAIPTRTTNLSFFDTRRAPITYPDELNVIEPQAIDYDPNKTYVAFVIGDGDNVRYIMTTRKTWMQERLATCQNADPKCPPLSWSISPHLPEIAPDVLQWYYDAARSTGSDYFILPPSGYQYAYPSGLNEEDQAKFVDATERAGYILGIRSVVHWEWFDSWQTALHDFLPRYARADGQIQGIFPINVPYLVEAFPWWPDDRMVEVVVGADGGKLAVFRPQSWRGVDNRDDFHMSPQSMADKLAAFPKGTVTWVYMTSDGGLSLANSFTALTSLLADHIQLVSTDAAAQLALDASQD